MDVAAREILVPMLVFLSVVSIGASVLMSQKQKRRMLEVRLRESGGQERIKSILSRQSGLLELFQKVGNFVSHGQTSTNLTEQLIRAGYLSTTAPAVYTGVKILLFVIGLAGVAIIVSPMKTALMTKFILILMGGTVLFFIPNVFVSTQLKKRHEEIRLYLPDAVDLLEICVTSGIGLDMAWNIVADEIQHVSPILANAMALTNFEIHLGAGRAEAMRHMGTRTGVDELSSLAAILTQTERFGTSIAETLRVFAASMREERTFAADENAEKMAVRLIIPMVLFIFPAVLVTVAGPAVITIAKVMIFGNR